MDEQITEFGQCVVHGCRSKPSRKFQHIGFFTFPTDLDQKMKWVRSLNKRSWWPSEHSCVCSKHFTDKDLNRNPDMSHTLLKDAVPTRFLEKATSVQGKARKTVQRKRSAVSETQSASSHASHMEQDNYNAEENDESVVQWLGNVRDDESMEGPMGTQKGKKSRLADDSTKSPHGDHSDDDVTEDFTLSQLKQKLLREKVPEVNGAPSTSQADLPSECEQPSSTVVLIEEENSWADRKIAKLRRKCTKARETVAKYRQKIKHLQTQDRRLKERITQLTEVLKGLKQEATDRDAFACDTSDSDLSEILDCDM